MNLENLVITNKQYVLESSADSVFQMLFISVFHYDSA